MKRVEPRAAPDAPKRPARNADSRGSGAKERFERIYLKIRSRICQLEYAPGTRLSEEALAREFTVSRTPIRSVLSRLEGEGLVQSRHGVGTFVTDVDYAALAEVYRLRLELAALIGKLKPRQPNARDLKKIETIARKCAMIPEAKAPKREFSRINIDFFESLVAMTANQPMQDVLRRLFYQSARIWMTAMPEQEVNRESKIFHREINEIIDAVKDGCLKKVGKLRRKHISEGLGRLLMYVGEPSD
ncbi:GntR family transcriptional regulator [Varunaivibrio sulfuroxidans]|uniref:GntR family transcriptional regulator n=1 Tax=Varunaivibrio sulfuroxidans TaxID=1773489 RepID=UPI0023E301DE|nr:GntR family transcriptional regulator [Varunaivibrio sulfuroxidans]WES30029.1 GntR family transcriptional regulator [Varunaivibrio sulfuroxidans]